MFAKISEVQQYHDGTGRIVSDVKKYDYNFKTNIPKFVDSIAKPKIAEAMKKLEWSYEAIFYIDDRKYELIKWNIDDSVEIEVDDRMMRVNKRYFRELYERRNK